MDTNVLEANRSVADSLERLEAQRGVGEPRLFRNACLDHANLLVRLCQEAAYARDYAQAERVLDDFTRFVSHVEADLDRNRVVYLQSQLWRSRGLVWELKGAYGCIVESDFLDAQTTLEKAEHAYDKAAEWTAQAEMPEEIRADVVGHMRSSSLWSKGVRAFAEGRFELETGATGEAQARLETAAQILEESGRKMPVESAGDSSHDVNPARGDQFVLYARAFLHRAAADEAAFQADYLGCAASLDQQAEMLRECKSVFLRMGRAEDDVFARRLAREVRLTEDRAKHFRAEAKKQPRRAITKGTIAFLAFSLGTISLLLWLAWQFQFERGSSLYASTLLFGAVVGGVAAGLATWQEGIHVLQSWRRQEDENHNPTR